MSTPATHVSTLELFFDLVWRLAAGVAVYLAGEVLFRRLLRLGPVRGRLVTAALAAATAPVGLAVGYVTRLTLLVLILTDARGRTARQCVSGRSVVTFFLGSSLCLTMKTGLRRRRSTCGAAARQRVESRWPRLGSRGVHLTGEKPREPSSFRGSRAL